MASHSVEFCAEQESEYPHLKQHIFLSASALYYKHKYILASYICIYIYMHVCIYVSKILA